MATSREGSRAVSGKPPTAVLGVPSRLSPPVSKRYLPRALAQLRQRERLASVLGEFVRLLEDQER
ncbi:hypothetical protein [Ferrimicrobium sp.]|uniref:hypothetical protein n=1 Tax=Ferrimicrobium sp. TaxID=2926050 RepID=UPI0026083963|nr:hypothetical protein [Ferrimicrobium sp.]